MYFKNILKLYLVGMLVGFNNLRVLEVAIFLIYFNRHLCIFSSKTESCSTLQGSYVILTNRKSLIIAWVSSLKQDGVKIGPFI